jgi:hypothetical protein
MAHGDSVACGVSELGEEAERVALALALSRDRSA